jgi:tetratricopeptide (TPR) repeat protein
MTTTQSMEELLKAGEVDQARALAEAALRKNKEDRTALLTLAKLATLDGEWEYAGELLERATQKGQHEDVDSRLVRAALAAQREDVDEARSLYEQIIHEAKPPRAEAFFGLGYLLASLEDYEGAREPLEKAVRLEPEVAPYRLHLARVLGVLEELQLALPHLEKALELNPLYPPVYVMWTGVLMELGEPQAAEELLRKGLEAMPNQPDLLNALGNVMAARGNAGGALAIAEDLVRQFPDDPAALGNLARVLMAVGRRDDALNLCRDMDEQGLATAQSKSIEGMVLECQDPPDVQGAMAAYAEAMDLDEEDWSSANNLGNLLMRREDGEPEKNLSQAIEVLEEARRRAPARPEPLLNLALAHARLGHKEQAKALAGDVMKIAPAEAKELREQAERLSKALG